MIDKFLTKVFGSSNQRFLKSVQPLVNEINALEPAIKKRSDAELRARTQFFKDKVQQAVAGVEDKDELKRIEREVLDEILPEAFAIVREASVRTTGMRHFDVQLIGGIVLHQGKDCRDADGRRQNARGHPAFLSQRPHRTRWRSRRYGERLPRLSRRGMDGSDSSLPRA